MANMKSPKTWALVTVILLATAMVPDHLFSQAASAVRVISIEGHRKRFDNPTQDAIQRYFLIDVTNGDWDGDGNQDTGPINPVGILALFPGGDGRLNLSPQTRGIGSSSPFESVRNHLAAEGFIVADVDAASDFLAHNHPQTREDPLGFQHGSGISGHQLPGQLYADSYKQDLEAVTSDLRQRYPGLPLFAAGLSLGTVSAFVAAIELAHPPDGIVLASTNTGPRNGVGDLGPRNPYLDRVRVPVLIIAHQDDPCPQTQPGNAALLAKALTASPRVEYVTLSGGYRGFGNETGTEFTRGCGGLNAHNFFGVEQELVRRVATWIRGVVRSSSSSRRP